MKFDALNRLLEKSVARAAGVVGTTLQEFAINALGQQACVWDDNGGGDSVATAYGLRTQTTIARVLDGLVEEETGPLSTDGER